MREVVKRRRTINEEQKEIIGIEVRNQSSIINKPNPHFQ
jgi:hypothetical protein